MKTLVVIPSDPIEAYEKKGTASWLKEYYNPQSFFDKVYVLSPIEKEEQEKYGLTIVPVKNNKHYKELVKKINPFLVRAYGAYWACDYAIFNKVGKIPVLVSVHDTSDRMIHESLRFADHIISMSKVIKQILVKKNIDIGKIDVLGNRVDCNKFNNNINKGKLAAIRVRYPQGKIVLHVGRKSEEKNLENVIKALVHLPKDHYLICIGQGSIEKYKALAEKLELDNRLFWIERVKNEDLPMYYNMADVLCVPSRWEGFGVVFIEAGACGTKIVTSNIAPMNEFLSNDHEMNFLVEDYEDEMEISEKIGKAINCTKRNDKTINFIKNKFEKSAIEAKEVEIYKQVILEGTKYHNRVAYISWKLDFVLKEKRKKYSSFLKRLWRRIS